MFLTAAARVGAAPLVLPESGRLNEIRSHPFTASGGHSSERGAAAQTGLATISSPSEAAEDYRLVHGRGYLPSRSVLEKSEFLKPLDADSLQLFRDIMT